MFEDAKARIDRADKLIAELAHEFETFSVANPGVLQVAEANGRTIIQVVAPPLPDSVTTLLGDAINNLRGSFDLMAYELAKGEKGCKFPFGKDHKAMTDALKVCKITNKCVLEYIRRMKPYFGGDDMLAQLHATDITGKHHTLIPTIGAGKIEGFQYVNPSNGNRYTLGTDTIPGGTTTLVSTDGNVLVTRVGNHTIKMYFPVGSGFGTEPIIETLLHLSAKVRGIVADIEHLVIQES